MSTATRAAKRRKEREKNRIHRKKTPTATVTNRAERRGQTAKTFHRPAGYGHASVTMQADSKQLQQLQRAQRLQELIDELDEADAALLLKRYGSNL